MNQAAFRSINTGGIHTGVSQNIRQPGQILLLGIKCPRKEMPKVMGKYFVRFHPRAFAQDFHIPPDVAPVQRPARPGDKHRPCCNPVPFQIAFQQTAQLFRQENAAPFSLVAISARPEATASAVISRSSETRIPVAQMGLEHQGKALLPLPPGGVHQAHIVGPGQLRRSSQNKAF